MKFHSTPLNGAYIIEMEPRGDQRGLFARTFCKREFEAIGHHKEFVQFNHSETRHNGTLRGMHYQVSPSCEIKLLRCIRGRVFDIIIDLRANSSTYMKWYGRELSEENKLSMYVPEGFAHGFQTLEDDCQLIYHHTQYYNPTAERGLRYNDPALAIQWPQPPTIMTEKDNNYPLIDKNFKGIDL